VIPIRSPEQEEIERLRTDNAQLIYALQQQEQSYLVLRKIATELRRWASCEHVHHDKSDQHEFDEPCKVLARIDRALSKEG
jgi:ABC-type uncharacterized transport system involved in gliding motility auxiliary subunit